MTLCSRLFVTTTFESSYKITQLKNLDTSIYTNVSTWVILAGKHWLDVLLFTKY